MCRTIAWFSVQKVRVSAVAFPWGTGLRFISFRGAVFLVPVLLAASATFAGERDAEHTQGAFRVPLAIVRLAGDTANVYIQIHFDKPQECARIPLDEMPVSASNIDADVFRLMKAATLPTNLTVPWDGAYDFLAWLLAFCVGILVAKTQCVSVGVWKGLIRIVVVPLSLCFLLCILGGYGGDYPIFERLFPAGYAEPLNYPPVELALDKALPYEERDLQGKTFPAAGHAGPGIVIHPANAQNLVSHAFMLRYNAGGFTSMDVTATFVLRDPFLASADEIIVVAQEPVTGGISPAFCGRYSRRGDKSDLHYYEILDVRRHRPEFLSSFTSAMDPLWDRCVVTRLRRSAPVGSSPAAGVQLRFVPQGSYREAVYTPRAAFRNATLVSGGCCAMLLLLAGLTFRLFRIRSTAGYLSVALGLCVPISILVLIANYTYTMSRIYSLRELGNVLLPF